MSNHPSFEGFPEEYSEAEIDESYDWVEHQTQKYFRAHMIGWVLGKVMRPIVTYEDEDALQEMIDADFAFNMVAKHTDLVDPFAADAAVHTEPALRHLQETRRSARKAGRPGRPRHTRPMSKIELSRKSDEVGRIANPLIRIVAGTPVPRSFTSPGEKGRYARKKAMEVTERNLVRGINSLSFPQGTRKTTKFDPEETKSGMAFVAIQAARVMEEHPDDPIFDDVDFPAGIATLPFAVDYSRGKLRPRIHFGLPLIAEPDTDVEELHRSAMAQIANAESVLEENA